MKTARDKLCNRNIVTCKRYDAGCVVILCDDHKKCQRGFPYRRKRRLMKLPCLQIPFSPNSTHG